MEGRARILQEIRQELEDMTEDQKQEFLAFLQEREKGAA